MKFTGKFADIPVVCPKEWWFLFHRDGEIVARQAQTTLPGPTAVFPVTYLLRGAHGNYNSPWCTVVENGPCRVFHKTFRLSSVEVTSKGVGVAHYHYVGLRRASPLQGEREKMLNPNRLPA